MNDLADELKREVACAGTSGGIVKVRAELMKRIEAALGTTSPSQAFVAGDQVREALRAFAIHACYPVDKSINPRGYEWRGEDALDYAKGLADRALSVITGEAREK